MQAAWAKERAVLDERLAKLEEALAKREEEQRRRDQLKGAILTTAADEQERNDSVHFWQARRLNWRRPAAEAQLVDSTQEAAHLAMSIGNQIGRLADSLSTNRAAAAAAAGEPPLTFGNAASVVPSMVATGADSFVEQHPTPRLPPETLPLQHATPWRAGSAYLHPNPSGGALLSALSTPPTSPAQFHANQRPWQSQYHQMTVPSPFL